MKSKTRKEPDTAAARWLTLVFQLPPKSAYQRVKLWRRLQDIGAVMLKNAVYVLPASDEAIEDFQWLLGEIEKSGGEGIVSESRILHGLRDDEVRAQFDAARDADYDALAKELKALIKAKPRGKGDRHPTKNLKRQLARLRKRFSEVAQIDFFGATGRMRVEGLLAELESEFRKPDADRTHAKGGELRGKAWVTRRDVHIDRIACAWLVHRFIDPNARFKFVAEKDYAAKAGELRFDMFKGEITHEGDRCSFEVLLGRAGLSDPALRAIGEIVHDIDLKDRKFARDETVGIAQVVAGICATQKDDLRRIEQGSAMLDGIYEQFRRRRRPG